jgi:CRISPR-associated protein Csx10
VAADIERIKKLLEAEPILVGRSRRAGYGGEAEVAFTEQTQREYENVSGSISRDVAAGASFRAFLASAYVGRHPATGQIDPGALQQELRRRIGGAVTVERTRWAFETVGAFNQKWRLEVPQALTVAAGAVLVLRASVDIPAATLRAIEHEGLGERRVEGFGRVLFLEHSDDQGTIRLHRGDDQVQADGGGCDGLAALSEQDRRQLDLVEQRIVLAAARAELDRVAAIDLAARAQNRPTNSLLGRLRTLFRRATDEPAAQAALANLRIWCSDGDNPQALKPNAREKLDRCRVSNERLRQWLRRLAESGDGEAGWDALVHASGNQATLTGLAAKSHLTARSAGEAVLHEHSALLRVHLIDSVLGAMARLNRRGAR